MSKTHMKKGAIDGSVRNSSESARQERQALWLPFPFPLPYGSNLVNRSFTNTVISIVFSYSGDDPLSILYMAGKC